MFVRQTTVSRRLSVVASSECWVETIIIIICNFCVRPANAAAAPAHFHRNQFNSWVCIADDFAISKWKHGRLPSAITQTNIVLPDNSASMNWRNGFNSFPSKSLSITLYFFSCAPHISRNALNKYCEMWIPLNSTEDEHKVSKRWQKTKRYWITCSAHFGASTRSCTNRCFFILNKFSRPKISF